MGISGTRRWATLFASGVGLALGLSAGASAAPIGQVTEFATPTGSAGPEGIVAGPDGNLWFAELAAGQIGELDPATGATTDYATPTAASGPLGIAVGPDGDIWFTEFTAGKIGEINPVTHAITEFATPTPNSEPVDIVPGPDGSMWFTESSADKIGEISPATHAVTEFPVPTAASQPFGIGVGPDGNIWFTEKAASKVAVISLATHTITEIPTLMASAMPNAIAAGPDGSLWFTESASAASRIGLVNTTADTIKEFPTPTQPSGPVVIAPGPDGEMWFTEGAAGKIGEINPVTDNMTEFSTPTGSGGLVGIATGADGNLWFTESATSKIGAIGAGQAAASLTAPAISGTPQVGDALTCVAATWSDWAGQAPSATQTGYDGYQWLRDGAAIAGVTASSYPLAAGDAGHQIACRETVTYPLFGTTAVASSVPTIVSPPFGGALTAAFTSGAGATLTLTCQGLPSQSCSGTAGISSRVTTRGSKTVAVVATGRAKKPPKRITRTVTVSRGSYDLTAGRTATVRLSLNATGAKALGQRYRLPGRLVLTGTIAVDRTLTFSYRRLHISPADTWAYAKQFSYATELTLKALPSGARVTVICRGGGCPFAKRTYAPKDGKLTLAPALEHRHLVPHATLELEITAPGAVGEVVVFTISSDRRPSEAFRCLPPGARGPAACLR